MTNFPATDAPSDQLANDASKLRQLSLLKTSSAAETVAFRTGTGYRPWHVLDRLSSPPFSTPRQLPRARSAPA